MKTALFTAIVATALSATSAWAGNPRIILHGVDCSTEHGTVCNEDRALFDEAIDSMPPSGTVIIQNHLLEARDGQPVEALSPDSAAAVRDYLLGAGIAPQRVEIEECSDDSGVLAADEPIELQLSNAIK